MSREIFTHSHLIHYLSFYNIFIYVPGIRDCDAIYKDEAELKSFLSLSEASKEEHEASYVTSDSSLMHDIAMIWNIKQPEPRRYIDDYQELNDSSVTRRDKYTFTTYSSPQEMEGAVQPVPDYWRWLQSNGELHYLPYDLCLKYKEELSASKFGLYLPSLILKPILSIFPDPQADLIHASAFLTWTTVKEVEEYWQHISAKNKAVLENDILREKLRELKFFEKSKSDLQKLCLEKKLSSDGSKIDLGVRIAASEGVDLDQITAQLYDGNLQSLPVSVAAINKLNVSVLRAILHYHNISHDGTKKELALRVYLLRANRKNLIHYHLKRGLLELIHKAEDFIHLQISDGLLSPTRHIKRRKFETRQEASVSEKNPRQMASYSRLYENAILPVPPGVTAYNITSLMKSLSTHLKVQGSQEQIDPSIILRTLPSNSQLRAGVDNIFCIGARVRVNWSKDEIGDSGWRPGWYVATVEAADMDNDWIKVTYLSEPGCIYKIDVSSFLSLGKLEIQD